MHSKRVKPEECGNKMVVGVSHSEHQHYLAENYEPEPLAVPTAQQRKLYRGVAKTTEPSATYYPTKR